MYLRKQLGLLRSRAIYYWKPFNKRRLKRFYKAFIQPGDLCFDIGAHLGNRTNAWLALGAQVIAVDPQPLCVHYLHRKFRNREAVKIVAKAIGSEKGKAQMHISAYTPTVSTLASASWRKQIDADTSFQVNWEETIEVEVITLDQLIENYGLPVFTKLDIENYELEALKGLSHPLPCLSMEFYYATMDRSIQCIELLENLGQYEYNYSFGESQKMESEKWLEPAKLKRIFSQITREDFHGDFYARLKK